MAAPRRDGAGNRTRLTHPNGTSTDLSTGQTFTWDVFNRLTQATGSGGTVTHTFNGDGLKVRRVGPDGTRRYYYDGIRPIWEADGAGVMTAQLDRDLFGNLLSRREASGARRYYHYDGLGSTTALTNESGAATSTLLYDAWGNQRAATGSDQGRYRFTGAELDAATGLYHMGARFYDPTIGRWLSEDPVQDQYFEPATLNFYAYCNLNPLILVDHDGNRPMVPGLRGPLEFDEGIGGGGFSGGAGGFGPALGSALSAGKAAADAARAAGDSFRGVGMAFQNAVAQALRQAGYAIATNQYSGPIAGFVRGRFVDVKVTIDRTVTIIEVKAGQIHSLTGALLAQAKKDSAIISQYGRDRVRAIWAVARGTAQSVIDELTRRGIDVVIYD